MQQTRRSTSGRRPGVAWVPVTRGVHRRADARDPFLADLHAWAQVLPSTARFTHVTAAALHGLWLPPLPAGLPVFVAMSPAVTRPQRPGLRVIRTTGLPGPLLVHGLPVDPPAEALLALSRDLAELDLAVLVDAALHLGPTSKVRLESAAARRRRGAPLLRRVLAGADGRSESPWETLLRRLHHSCGIDVVPQHEVRDAHGAFVARGDLWLRGTRTLHEYDGGDHLEVAQQRRDLRRARRLAEEHWTRRGYTSQDLLHRAVGVLRDADLSLGRPHDPRRVRRWHLMLRASCFTPAGRSALLTRLGIGESGGRMS